MFAPSGFSVIFCWDKSRQVCSRLRNRRLRPDIRFDVDRQFSPSCLLSLSFCIQANV